MRCVNGDTAAAVAGVNFFFRPIFKKLSLCLSSLVLLVLLPWRYQVFQVIALARRIIRLQATHTQGVKGAS